MDSYRTKRLTRLAELIYSPIGSLSSEEEQELDRLHTWAEGVTPDGALVQELAAIASAWPGLPRVLDNDGDKATLIHEDGNLVSFYRDQESVEDFLTTFPAGNSLPDTLQFERMGEADLNGKEDVLKLERSMRQPS